jgi:hypothetical protein
MRFAGWVLAFAACAGGAEEPAITLEGPTDVRVEKLGPVEGPRVLQGDGTEAPGLSWSVSVPSVATVQDGQVVAVGPGKTAIIGTVGRDHVQWTLSVDPTLTLGFVDPPGRVAVGKEVPLVVEARAGTQVVPAGHLDWTTSNPGVLTVVEGQAKGIAVGTAFVSAHRGASEAMVQIEVVQ